MEYDSFVELQEIIGRLKQIKRTGWVIRSVPDAETVAAHSWRMALMALQMEKILQDMGADSNHIIEMCLLHDVGEAIIGDIVPEHHQTGPIKISQKEKSQKELDAISILAEKYRFTRLLDVFTEYESAKTLEAHITKNLDKLDMLLQAYEYLKLYPDNQRLYEFMAYNEKSVDLMPFQKVVAEIKSRQIGENPREDLFLEFQQICGILKHVKRSDLKKYLIENNETIAAHCYQTAVIALQLDSQIKASGACTRNIVKMMLVREASEAVIHYRLSTQEHTGIRGSKVDKNRIGDMVIFDLAKKYHFPFIWSSYREMKEQKTLETVWVKDIEKYEEIQKAYEYGLYHPEKNVLKECISYHKQHICNPFLHSVIDRITQKQNSF